MGSEAAQEKALWEIKTHLSNWNIEPALDILSRIIKFEIGGYNSGFNKIKRFAATNKIKEISEATKEYTTSLEGLTRGIKLILELEKTNPKKANEYRKKTLRFAIASKQAFDNLLNLTHKHGLTMNT